MDGVSVVDEAVEDGVAEGWIADDIMPVIDRHLGGDERGSVAMWVIEQLEQIATLLGGELGQPPVIEDDQVGLVTIGDLGGWMAAQAKHFADGGIFDQLYSVR